jgi:hypothetical protein
MMPGSASLSESWPPALFGHTGCLGGVGAAVLFTVINLIGITFSAVVQLILTLVLFGGIFAYALPDWHRWT